MDALRDLLSTVNLVDIVGITVIAIAMVIGAIRGLSGELAGAVSTVIGFILGMVFFNPMVDWLVENSRLAGQSSRIVAFIVVFFVVFAIMLVIRIGVKALIRRALEEKADRWGGALAGMVKALVIVLAFFLIMILSPSESMGRIFGEESMIGSLLVKAIPELKEGVSGHIDDDSGVMRLLDGESE